MPKHLQIITMEQANCTCSGLSVCVACSLHGWRVKIVVSHQRGKTVVTPLSQIVAHPEDQVIVLSV